jgi:fructose-1-phosphate kinase PfkB-like protein
MKHQKYKDILIIGTFCLQGLNPAFQSTLQFEHFQPGEVNRSFRKSNSIGGKGQNVAIACKQYGCEDRCILLQITGFDNITQVFNVD